MIHLSCAAGSASSLSVSDPDDNVMSSDSPAGHPHAMQLPGAKFAGGPMVEIPIMSNLRSNQLMWMELLSDEEHTSGCSSNASLMGPPALPPKGLSVSVASNVKPPVQTLRQRPSKGDLSLKQQQRLALPSCPSCGAHGAVAEQGSTPSSAGHSPSSDQSKRSPVSVTSQMSGRSVDESVSDVRRPSHDTILENPSVPSTHFWETQRRSHSPKARQQRFYTEEVR